MKLLKGFALGLLGFLLFLSLSAFGLVFTLNSTVLNPDFTIAQIERLDIPSLVEETIRAQVPQDDGLVTETVDNTLADLRPWISEQANTVVRSGYDYLLGKSQGLSIVISLEPVKESVRDNLREAILRSPPPELALLPPALIDQYIDEYYRQISQQIPSTFEIDQGSLPPDVLTILEQARQGIGYFQIAYWALIGLIVVLILGIVLIHREVKGAARSIGGTFLSYGIIEYAGIWATKYFVTPQFLPVEVPAPLQAWLPQLIGDFLAPLEKFSLGVLIAGAILIIVSFVYRRE